MSANYLNDDAKAALAKLLDTAAFADILHHLGTAASVRGGACEDSGNQAGAEKWYQVSADLQRAAHCTRDSLTGPAVDGGGDFRGGGAVAPTIPRPELEGGSLGASDQ